MQRTSRRIVGGIAAAGVVAAMTTVTTWAVAGESTGTAAAADVQLVVGYKNAGTPATAAEKMSAAGARAVAATAQGEQALGELKASAVQVSSRRSSALIAALRADPNVEYVEIDRVRTAYDLTPTDPVYAEGLQPEAREVNLPAAWEVTTGSAIKIAVVDTGVTPVGDLAGGAVLPGYNFVGNNTNTRDDVVARDGTIVGHGTLVASLIAARGNNGQGMAGGCWQCRILPVKVLNRNGSGSDSTVAKGIVYAVKQGAKVVNLSLGGSDPSSVLASAVNYALDRGVLVVAAAGNENTTKYSYPAAYNDVLSVGATARNSNSRASFSNYNSSKKWVDVAAPGIITAMDPHGNYNTGEAGTSFAAPIVSGIAGLLLTKNPSWQPYSALRAIQSSSRSVGSWVTYGKVDAAKALTMTTDRTAPKIGGTSPGQGAKVRGTLSIKPSGVSDSGFGVRLIDLYVDGKWKALDRAGPWELKYNTKSRGNGTAQLRLRVVDKAGNTAFYNRTVTIDNTPPAVKITKAPKNKAKVKGTIKVKFTGSDKYGIKKYQLLVNGKVVATKTNAATPFSLKVSKQKKKFTVRVRAYDVAGNSKLSTKYTYTR